MKYHLKKTSNQFTGQLLKLGQLCCLLVLLTSCGGNDGIIGPVNAEEFIIAVESDLPDGSVFGSVSVTNNTGLSLTFVLESQTPDGAIAIDPNSGALSVANSQLFNENVSPIQAVYTAISENGERDTAPITITVLPIDPTKDRNSFVTTWRTTVAGESVTIPTFPGLTYNYNVNWGDDSQSINQTGNVTHVYATAGTYEISISGDFPSIYINNGPQRLQIQTIEQWGNIEWETMQEAFESCTNLTYNATDVPDLSRVTNMERMFASTNLFNGFIGGWDVSNVTNMRGIFSFARAFNQNINDWDVSNVTDMSQAFFFATSFNQPLNDWDVSSVTNMSLMLEDARVFNQPLNDWDVSNVTNMNDMFEDCRVFNQPLDNWDVSNVTSMANMFEGAFDFNSAIGTWDVSNVTNMGDMFEDAVDFNQPLNNWDVGNVTFMREMFDNARNFNQPLNDWDVSRVTDMGRMFERANSFNQPLNNWDVSSVTRMWRMFINNTAFNQDISGWTVGGVTDCGTFNTNGVLSAGNFPNFTSCTP